MTTAVPSTVLVTIQPVFTAAGRVALAGFLAGYRGLTREAYALGPAPVHRLVPRPFARPVRGPPCRHRVLRPGPGSDGPRPGHRYPAAVNHCQVLQIRRPRRDPGSLARRTCAPSAGRLRVPCRRAGSQRQGGDRPAGTADCPGARPGHRRAHRRPGVPGCGWAAGPAWGGADSPQDCPPHGIAKTVTPHTLRHAFITAALDAGVPLRDVQEAASHADPRTTMRYDRARSSLDRHATYIVAAYLAGAAR